MNIIYINSSHGSMVDDIQNSVVYEYIDVLCLKLANDVICQAFMQGLLSPLKY